LLLDAALVRRIDHRARVLEAVLRLQRRIRSIEVDPPRADDRQLRRIHLLGGDTIAAEEATAFLAEHRQLLNEQRQPKGRNEEREITAGSGHDHFLMSVSVPYFGLASFP